MDDFIGGFKKISDFYIRDSEGNYINIQNGSGDSVSTTMECKRVNEREENLISLDENLEVMSQAIGDAQFLINEELDGEVDRNLDLKIILKLNRIENELEACYDMLIEKNL